MKTREEFITSVFAKAEKAKAAPQKRRFRLAGGLAAAAACVMLAVGIGSSGLLDGAMESIGFGDVDNGEYFVSEPVADSPYADGEEISHAEGRAIGEDRKKSAVTSGSMDSGSMDSGSVEKTEEDDISSNNDVNIDEYKNGSKRSVSTLNLSDYKEDGNKIMQNISVDLFKQAASSKKNSMISPISVITALGMVENGAAGNTKTEMEKAFGMKTDAMTRWLKDWTAAQKNKSDDSSTKINIANAFWYNKASGFKPDSDYKSILKKAFGAEIKGGNFDLSTVNQINKWVDNQTDGMIKKLVNRLNAEDMMVLANAVAFQDEWTEPYSRSQVKKERFTLENGTKKKMNFMYSSEASYFHDDMATGFAKPYKSGYKFVAILPNEGVTVKEYLDKMDGESFGAFLASEEEARVNGVMPAFKSEYSVEDMMGALKKMGIKDLFDFSAADLSGMGDVKGQNLFVGDIIHKTFIEVDREGTKAAAVTGVIVKATSMMPAPLKEYTVRLDRPYIYAIIDEETQIPVFMGTMMGV